MGALSGVLLLVAAAQPTSRGAAIGYETLAGLAGEAVAIGVSAALEAGQDCSEGCAGLVVAIPLFPLLAVGGVVWAGHLLKHRGSILAALGGGLLGVLILTPLGALWPPLVLVAAVGFPVASAFAYELTVTDTPPVALAPMIGPGIRGVSLALRF